MVNLTIDGKPIQVPEGTTVLRAAQSAGIDIPTLCDHPALTPYGGCRLCLVEVEGARTLQPSCTLPASDKMVVKTDTEKVKAARKFVLTLIFSERNHFCPYCQVSGGDCELQNAAYHEDMTHWQLQPNWQPYAMDASHPNIILENNRCILCRRCVRACGELVGNFTLGFEERGANSFLVADFGTPLGESTCVSCGTCVQVCPTGALIDRKSAYQGRETQVEHHNTICVGCSIGCGIDVLTRDNRLVRIEGNWDSKINGGVLCKAGRFDAADETRERVLTPLVRKNGSLKAATWEEALGIVAEKLHPLAGRNGSGVAALASTRLPAEALASIKQLFADKLGSNMVTSIEEGFSTAVQASFADQAGKSFEGKLDDLQQSDLIVILGVNLAENHQLAGFLVKRKLPAGTKLIVIDQNANYLDELADVTLKSAKISDVEILQALTTACQGGVVGDLALKVGIPVDSLSSVVQLLSSAARPVFIFGKGIANKGGSTALQALVGLAEAVHGKLISTKGQANSMAASQYNLDKAFELNGHQAAFLSLGDDEPSNRLLQRLEKVPFLAVQASYISPATAKADVVLPVEMWAEQSGHYLSLEGKLQESSASLQAPEGVRSTLTVLKDLAQKLGYELEENWKEELTRRIPIVAIEA